MRANHSCVGNTGAKSRFNYSAVGGAVNVATRRRAPKPPNRTVGSLNPVQLRRRPACAAAAVPAAVAMTVPVVLVVVVVVMMVVVVVVVMVVVVGLIRRVGRVRRARVRSLGRGGRTRWRGLRRRR